MADSRSSSAWFSKRSRNASTIERWVVRATTDIASAYTTIMVPIARCRASACIIVRTTSGSSDGTMYARYAGRWQASVPAAPAPMPPITNVSRICDSTPPTSKNRNPAAPHSRPAHSDPATK